MIFEIKNHVAMREALDALCSYLAQQGVPPERVFDSKLVATELVGNVLRHSDGIAKLCGEIEGGFIELIVFSSIPFIPPKTSQKVEVYAEGGRGLYLVDSVCEERFSTGDGGIKVRIRVEK